MQIIEKWTYKLEDEKVPLQFRAYWRWRSWSHFPCLPLSQQYGASCNDRMGLAHFDSHWFSAPFCSSFFLTYRCYWNNLGSFINSFFLFENLLFVLVVVNTRFCICGLNMAISLMMRWVVTAKKHAILSASWCCGCCSDFSFLRFLDNLPKMIWWE